MVQRQAFLVKWSGRRDSNPRSRAPKARALPGYATPRKVLATEPDARRGVPSHVSGALIIRPRAMSTPIRVESRRADRIADLHAERPDARGRLTDDADRGSRRFPITASTDWYAPIRTGGTREVAPSRQIHAQSRTQHRIPRADPARRGHILCVPVWKDGFGRSGDPAARHPGRWATRPPGDPATRHPDRWGAPTRPRAPRARADAGIERCAGASLYRLG